MSNYDTDFAPALIAANKLTKEAHSAFIKGKYDDAVAHGTKALVELRMAVIAMKSVADSKQPRD